MALAGRACLILALAICLYGIGASLYGARARPARARRLRPPRGLRAGRACSSVAFAILEVGVPALGLLVRARRDALLDDDAALLPADRDVVLAGGLAAAVGAAARAVVER